MEERSSKAPHLWPELQPGKLSNVHELHSTTLTIRSSTANFISIGIQHTQNCYLYCLDAQIHGSEIQTKDS